MSEPTKDEIEGRIEDLIDVAQHHGDPVVQRIAYQMYHELRWVIEDTVDWGSGKENAEETASLVRRDIAQEIQDSLNG